jgi:hypothetical protein
MLWIYNSLENRAIVVSLIIMSPRLPIEITLSILELSFAVESWDSLPGKPSQFLLINRGIHGHLLPLFYRTIILKTHHQIQLLSRTSRSSPHLMKLISNIWVCSPLLDGQYLPSKVKDMLYSTTLPPILSSATNLQRLALPSIEPHFARALALLPKAQPLFRNLHSLFIDDLYACPGAPIYEHFTNIKRLLAPLPFGRDLGLTKNRAEFFGRKAVLSIGPLPTPLEEITLCFRGHPYFTPTAENWEICLAKGRSKEELVVSFNWMRKGGNMFLFDKWLKG